jgi:hypothetical protein
VAFDLQWPERGAGLSRAAQENRFGLRHRRQPGYLPGARQLRVGGGRKSGVYHVFDARTGKITWQRELSKPFPSGGISGIQWGTSYDGVHLYLATYYAEPGTLHVLSGLPQCEGFVLLAFGL